MSQKSSHNGNALCFWSIQKIHLVPGLGEGQQVESLDSGLHLVIDKVFKWWKSHVGHDGSHDLEPLL